MVNGATPTFISKNASIIYPQVIVPSNPIPFTPTPTVNTGTNPITTSNLFYAPCTVTMSVLSNISYSFPASGTNTSFTVVDKISGQIPFPIDDTNNCNLICGLNNYWKNWVLPNPNNDEYYETYCYLASLYVTLTGLQGCGEPDGVDTLIAEMNATAGFSDCCSCCTQGVHQVVGIGGLVNIYDVQSANSYITVTPVVSGNTKTFTIELSVAFVTLVNSILGATLVAGDNIVLSSSTSGANTTWTINALGVTVVSANESITVTPTATGNNTEYDLSLKTYAQTQLTTVTLSAPSTDYAIFGTPIQVSEAGTYMMFFEADLTSTGLLDMNAQYHPYKNSAPTVNISTFGSTDIRVVANSFPSTTTIEKITMNTTVNLLRLDTINININAGTLSATGYITKASILLIKIG